MALAIGATELVDLGSLVLSGYPFTLAGWFRVQNLSQVMTLMGIGNSATGSYHRIVHLGSTTKRAAAVSNTLSASSTAAMVAGQWHHVAGVFESATSRRVYLDGGNSGTNATNRVFDGADQFFLGNVNSTSTVDVAEAAVWNRALSAAEIGMLAAGISSLCLPQVDNLLAYQNCVRALNWPGLGPEASAVVMPSAVAHPRIQFVIGGTAQTVPNRLPGPFLLSRGCLRAGVESADVHLAGVASRGGQMLAPGTEAGQVGLAEEQD